MPKIVGNLYATPFLLGTNSLDPTITGCRHTALYFTVLQKSYFAAINRGDPTFEL
jgi:hypothetical protein